jgi:hypothetical protein
MSSSSLLGKLHIALANGMDYPFTKEFRQRKKSQSEPHAQTRQSQVGTRRRQRGWEAPQEGRASWILPVSPKIVPNI